MRGWQAIIGESSDNMGTEWKSGSDSWVFLNMCQLDIYWWLWQMIMTLVKCPSRVASQTYRRTYSDHNSHSRGQGAVWQWENSSTTCKRDSFVTLLAFCASCTKSNWWNIESEGKKIQITDTSREVSITKIRQMLSKPFMNYYFKHFCYWCTLVNYWCQKSRHQNIWQSCPSWQTDCWALHSQSCGYWTMGEMWVPLLMPESVFCN